MATMYCPHCRKRFVPTKSKQLVGDKWKKKDDSYQRCPNCNEPVFVYMVQTLNSKRMKFKVWSVLFAAVALFWGCFRRDFSLETFHIIALLFAIAAVVAWFPAYKSVWDLGTKYKAPHFYFGILYLFALLGMIGWLVWDGLL